MLLKEWFVWYEAMPNIDALERITAYTVHLLADSGWTIDRDQFLKQWAAMAERAEALAPPSDPHAPSVRTQARRVFGWLQANFGGQVSYA